jgi:hypothetical protein
VAIELRKDTIRTPTRYKCAEGNMDRSASASSCSVRRSRRPHGTPRNFMHENRETSEASAVHSDGRSAGEGLGHKSRVYVCEESHRGVVPMNRSNKGRILSAESEEGRLRLKENIPALDTYPTQCGTARAPQVAGCGVHVVCRYYPREEPDALMSARPDLCGGHRETGVPTAINYFAQKSFSSMMFGHEAAFFAA